MKSALFLIEGFFAKIITGADDTLIHTPLVALLTKSKRGKFIFVSGMFTSILILIVISLFLANLLQTIPYKNIISAVLLILLAVLIYYNKLIPRGREKYIHWMKGKIPKESKKFVLYGMGLLVFFATGIDDMIVYSTLLTKTFSKQLLIIAGILIATILELFIVFYFSRTLSKIKHLEKITITGLIILATLVGFQII